MKLSVIKRYKKLTIVIVLFLLVGILYSYGRWDSYLELDREEREFVDAALSGIQNVQFKSKRWIDNENKFSFGFYSRGPDRLETFNELRENINQYWESHPEGYLVKYKVMIHLEHIHNQGPLIAFYNFNGSAQWQALLNTRVEETGIIASPESLLCLSDCKRLELSFVPQNCEIFRQFSNLEYLVLGKSLTEEKKEELQKMLPNTYIYSR